MTSASTIVTTSSINVVLGFILVTLLVVYVRQVDHPSIVEPFSTEKDGPVVAALKYTYFFASQIAIWLVKLPYKLIGRLLELPGRILRPLLRAFQPFIDLLADITGTVKSVLKSVGEFFKNIFTKIADIIKNFPQYLKKVILFFVNSIKSIFEMLGSIMTTLYDIGSFLFELPYALIKIFSKLSGLLSSLPRLLMKIPDKGIDLMMKGTDTLSGML
jgi:hypothetical protein